MVIVEGLVDVAEIIFSGLIPVMGKGLVSGFNALALQTVGADVVPTELILVLFMWVLVAIATGAIGKAFMVASGRR